MTLRRRAALIYDLKCLLASQNLPEGSLYRRSSGTSAGRTAAQSAGRRNQARSTCEGKSHNILEAPNEPKEDAISIKIECRQIGIPLDSMYGT